MTDQPDQPDQPTVTSERLWSRDRELIAFAATAQDLASSTAVSFTEAYAALLKASGLLAEAERRGAERGWDEGRESVARELLRSRLLDPGGRPEQNPYRTGADHG